MILAYKKKANTAALIWLISIPIGIFVIFISAVIVNPQTQHSIDLGMALVGLFSGIAFVCSCWFYIKAKGRSGWWILMLVFSIVGLIVLALLKDRAKDDQSKVAHAPVESHRKWAGIMALNKLNGWQRLWVLITILWIVPVGFFAYEQRPPQYFSARVVGCVLPGEWFSLSAPGIVNDELVNWRRELPPNLVRNPDDELIQRPQSAPVGTFLTEFEVFGYMPGFPEWKGDPLGRPEWAKAPWVKAYCKTLIERLERSGRAVQLRDASTNAMLKPRIKWLALVFAAWIGPAVVAYLLGLAIFWVGRGFRKQP